MLKRAALLFSLALCVAGSGHAGAQERLALRANSEVNRPVIRLGDVFSGLPEGKDVDIAQAPAAGKSVVYDARVLVGLARQHQLDWRPTSFADRAVLTRASIHVPTSDIQSALAGLVAEREKKERRNLDIQLDGRLVSLALPAETEGKFEVARFDYVPETRRFQAELVAGSGADVQRPIVSGRVVFLRDIPVLARSLPAGAVVSSGDLEWTLVPEDRINGDVLAREDQVVGLELRRAQSAGDRLTGRDVIAPRLVTRGSLVTIKVETPLMTISAQGKALQDGAKGETVRVMNTQSNRIVEGTVDAAGVVRVGTPRVQPVAAVE